MTEPGLALMGDEQIVYVIIAILYFVGQVVSAVLKKKRANESATPARSTRQVVLEQPLGEAPAPAAVPTPPPAPATIDSTESPSAHLLRRLAAAQKQAEAAAAQFKLRRDLYHFVQPIEQHLLPSLESLKARIIRYSFSGESLSAAEEIERFERAVAHYVQAVMGLQRLARQRNDPLLRGMLADADRLANACFEPLRQFADAHLDRAPIHHVLCRVGSKALVVNNQFAPANTALVHLPPEFLADVLWWPAIAHEIGHLIYWNFPGFRREVLRLSGGEPAQNLYWMQQQLTTQHLINLVALWSEEILCDMVGALMLGPAYLLTQLTHFRAARPQDIAIIGLSQRLYDHHPPSHLRVLVAYQTLRRAGFNEQVTPLWQRWLAAHGDEVPELLMPVMEGGYVAVPAHYFTEILTAFVETIFSHQFDALAGHQLASVPGLGFTLAEHFNATRDVPMLEGGADLRKYDSREMLAAVVYLADRGGDPAQLMATLRKAVIGIGVGETISTPFYDLPVHSLFKPALIRDAVILNDVLRSRRTGRF